MISVPTKYECGYDVFFVPGKEKPTLISLYSLFVKKENALVFLLQVIIMFYPMLKARKRAKPIMTNQFGGLNRSNTISENEFSDMKNISGRRFPFVASSGKRKVIKKAESGEFKFVHAPLYHEGELSADDFCGIIGNEYFYNNEKKMNVLSKRELPDPFNDAELYPQLQYANDYGTVEFSGNVNFFSSLKFFDPLKNKKSYSGTKLVYSESFSYGNLVFKYSWSNSLNRFSNALYYYDDDDYFGKVGETFGIGDTIVISYNLSDFKDDDGIIYNNLVYDTSDPEMYLAVLNHTDNKTMIVNATIRDISTEVITDSFGIETEYVKILYVDLYNVHGDFIRWNLPKPTSSTITTQTFRPYISITISKYIPVFSHYCVSCGRIFATDTFGKTVYASKTGDASVWTPSAVDGAYLQAWFTEVGSSGNWTGIIEFSGAVYCFKSDICYVIFGDNASNFMISKTINRGCIDGRSLKVIGNCLYFLSSDGFYALSGGQPVKISECLNKNYTSCVAGVFGNSYYASCHYDEGVELLVYYSDRNMWYKEDDFDAIGFFAYNNKLYGYSKYELICFGDGQLPDEWYVVSKKYDDATSSLRGLCELFLRLKMPAGSDATVFVSFDGGVFEKCGFISRGKITGTSEGSIVSLDYFNSETIHDSDISYYQRIPIRLRASSSYQFKLVCHGDVTLEAIERSVSMNGQFQR